ncbi:DUF4192 domain-containing protein [Streptomyces sp. NPDC005551]|uniref:DUF4192 domain-containing protein n=1 Tax=Streptomyces sp. NPDC005551 TaxID=3364725 RepID=UPI0036A6320A
MPEDGPGGGVPTELPTPGGSVEEPGCEEARDPGLDEAHDREFGEPGAGADDAAALAGGASPSEPLAFAGHAEVPGLSGQQQVTLRTPAELADALPYLLGYRPEDSIVLVALHDRERSGRFGGRARLGIPAQTDDWPSVAGQLARGLVTGSERRSGRPETMVAYLCQEPRSGETGRDVMERLRPLAQLLRTACGSFDVPVVEALCISDGRFWSYCCPSEACCPPQGQPMGLPGTSVLAAAATYAGLQVRGSLREFRARLTPWETGACLEQEAALDAASMALVPRILDDVSRAEVAEETLDLARKVMGRLADARPMSGTLEADIRDDGLLGHDEAAALILGIQDRTTRDRAAQWMEGAEAGPALRLWRALARRCVGPYGEHAAAPLTLAGWVAWSSGDELEAREALAMALGADSDYLFARLLHQACNEGLDPESIRRCLRAERGDGTASTGPVENPDSSDPAEPLSCAGPPAAAVRASATVRRRRRVRSAAGGGTHPGHRAPGAASPRHRRPDGSRSGARSLDGNCSAGDEAVAADDAGIRAGDGPQVLPQVGRWGSGRTHED